MEQERFISLVRESVLTLCRNAMVKDGVKKVEGLLGITLSTDQVLLVNVQEDYSIHIAPEEIKQPPSPEDITLVIAPEPQPTPSVVSTIPILTDAALYSSQSIKEESAEDECILLSDESGDEEMADTSFQVPYQTSTHIKIY
jgi:hypothetical protein